MLRCLLHQLFSIALLVCCSLSMAKEPVKLYVFPFDIMDVAPITPALLAKKSLAAKSKLFKSVKKPTSAKSSGLPAGQKILKTGRYMALVSKEIVRGSCWDYINTVYKRAGYPQSKRRYILKGKKKSGPYAKTHQIQPGDWLYYINHSYHGVEHSGIFVNWVNKKKRMAMILSYQGQARKKPGRYRKYDLSNVYTIIRPKS